MQRLALTLKIGAGLASLLPWPLALRANPGLAQVCKVLARTLVSLGSPPNTGRKKRYANRSAHFINAYSQGLSGPEAAWANRKYHGHRCLPPDILADLKKEFEKKYGGDK